MPSIRSSSMASATTTRAKGIRNLQCSAVRHPRYAQHRRGVAVAPHVLLRLLRQSRPNLHHPRPPSREHAVLHAVEDPAVNGWYEAARHQAQDNARVEVVLAQAVCQLKVLIKHGTEGERNRLAKCQNRTRAYFHCGYVRQGICTTPLLFRNH